MTASMFIAPTTHDSSPLPLYQHHVAIEKACRELLAREFTYDPRELLSRFRELEHILLDHLEVEEVVILPDYSAFAPQDARAIREEHAHIRRMLLRIGLDIELHHVRAQAIRDLVDTLRAHAAHEDGKMYEWADTHLATSTKHARLARVAWSLRALVGGEP